jgi:hypothetical protein
LSALAPAYLPRRPTETVLYGLVREHLASFLAHARESHDGGLPRYVEAELRAYLKCGVFSEGFTRCHCDACGHDLLVAFSCKGRSICPSCCGRRMANVAAHLVDRVLPDVPLRQFVLSLPYELRRLAAFKADVLTALARIFVEAIFAEQRAGAKRAGVAGAQCGSVTFVQRFGSLNLNVHFHVVAVDGVFSRDTGNRVRFHRATPPTPNDLDAIVRRVHRRSMAWLRRHGYTDDGPPEGRSDAPSEPTALGACAAVAMGRGQITLLPRSGAADADAGDHDRRPDKLAVAVERDGFNLHAGVRIDPGDDVGRERLCRYGVRPPVSLERLRRLPGGRVAYRLKYVGRGRGKHRVMTAMEFMARLSAIIAPPRYPLVRYGGVLAPRSAWRRDVVPRPPERPPPCREAAEARAASRRAEQPEPPRPKRMPTPASNSTAERDRATERVGSADAGLSTIAHAPPAAGPGGGVDLLTPNVISVPHWDRLLGGALYASSPRVDWARLLRRAFDVDVLECPKCHGRLRVLAVVTEREPVQRILAHIGMPTEAPPVARARDPTDDGDEADAQLGLA